MKIAVAGGTGVVGREVANAVFSAGHLPVVLARSTGVDVVKGTGLDRLDGVARIIDVTNVRSTRRSKSVKFFESATRNLLAAGSRAGIDHYVALSIVGCERVDFGYYVGKRRQEELVLTGPVPSTVLRATQFHEFAHQLVQRSGRLVVVPRMLCRPVAAREVAAALVDTVLGDASERAPDIAGPEEEQLVDMVRRVVAARRARRIVVPIALRGDVGAGMAQGALLPTRGWVRGQQTFDGWLGTIADGAVR